LRFFEAAPDTSHVDFYDTLCGTASELGLNGYCADGESFGKVNPITRNSYFAELLISGFSFFDVPVPATANTAMVAAALLKLQQLPVYFQRKVRQRGMFEFT